MKGYRKLAIASLGMVLTFVELALWGDSPNVGAAFTINGVIVTAVCGANLFEHRKAAEGDE